MQQVEICNKIVKCFNDKDKSNLRLLFNSFNQRRTELESEIEESFLFLDNEIEDFKIDNLGYTSYKKQDGIVVSYISAPIIVAKTNSEQEYTFHISYYQICKINKLLVGIGDITIIDDNSKESVKIGQGSKYSQF